MTTTNSWTLRGSESQVEPTSRSPKRAPRRVSGPGHRGSAHGGHGRRAFDRVVLCEQRLEIGLDVNGWESADLEILGELAVEEAPCERVLRRLEVAKRRRVVDAAARVRVDPLDATALGVGDHVASARFFSRMRSFNFS